MKIRVCFPHRVRNPSIRDLVDRYLRYSARYLPVEVVTKSLAGRSGKGGRAEPLEGLRDGLVVLSQRGQAVDSLWFRSAIEEAVGRGRDLNFLIGPAEGFPDDLEHQGLRMISLTPLTLPHELVLVLLTEQIWRGISLLNHHPYHRGSGTICS